MFAANVYSFDIRVDVFEFGGNSPRFLYTMQGGAKHSLAVRTYGEPETGKIIYSAPSERTLLGHNYTSRDVFISDRSKITAVTTHSAVDGDPVLSSDGKSVVFVSSRDGDFEIYRIALDGSEVLQLTDNDSTDYTPIVISGF